MESLPGAESLHGPIPDNQNSTVPQADSAAEQFSHSNLSLSSPLAQKRISSLPHGKTARHAKRLTLNFPINLNEPETPDNVTSPGAITPVTQSSTRPSTAQLPGTPMAFDVPDDGYDFLRAIASQERKVMELREELTRAEADLATIKKQWALSEKSRKRAEINHAEPLVPLRTPDFSMPELPSSHGRGQSISSVASSTVSQERMSRDLGRRSSLRAAAATPGTKIGSNGRRVFHGTHTRTLSLLSPVSGPGISSRGESGFPDAASERVGRTPRSATLPSVDRNNAALMGAQLGESQVPEHLLAQWQKTIPPPSREALVRTGKQMASDLREGLWTFLEDIRQATVGEEGINGTKTRSSPSNSLAPSNGHHDHRRRLRGGGGQRPRQKLKSPNAPRTPSDTKAANRSETNEAEHRGHRSSSSIDAQDEDFDSWDSWDTPLSAHKTHTPSSSRSTVASKHDQSPTTQDSSPRTSASFGDLYPASSALDPSVTEGIPWPAITKLAPSKLQRTASNLMAEWERSLSPSSERTASPSFSRKDSKKD
ncbi:mst3-like protein kinase [Penicillium digitatum]|uniref:Mst3-like protein kinase n=1 Tax=Penicillium digitatum TaxID=36651 RepID=A0A7T6XM65_PENDI|nr:mst3-like protein kinase [Penicillium digitatum]